MKKIIGIIIFIAAAISAFSALLYKKYLYMGNNRRKGFCGELPAESKRWLNDHEKEDTYLISRDGYCLYAALYDNNSDNWVILVHGYDADNTYMTGFTSKYYNEGYSVLVIDQRGYGLSGDNETTMGHLEKYDVIDWARMLTKEHGAKNIMLHGISMGAATVMLTASEKLPDTVRCIVEDCGYTSVKEQFEYSIQKIVHVPPYPFLWITDMITRYKKGWSLLRDADCIKAVSGSNVPICFIHGRSDTFVPFRMQEKLYNACRRDDKVIISVDDAGHTEAVEKDPELYWNTVSAFAKKYFI